MGSTNFARMLLVRQHFPDRQIHDIEGEVRRQLSTTRMGSRLKPGSRIAIGVGSRGIRNIATIVRSVVDYWKSEGMRPFIIPAMGSHGAGSAEGQRDVLAGYGITEPAMGCPIISQVEVVSLGKTSDGIEVFLDRTAFESDGVMVINRVKWHTVFTGKIESGLYKMMAIGLGKFAGAQYYHIHSYNMGIEQMVRSVGRQVLKSGKILGGLAILEDAYQNTAKLDAVPVDVMEQREEENLALVKSWMGKIPVDLDVLIIDEIGKNISGGGMDTKVVNRNGHAQYNPHPGLHKVERIFARDLTEESHGNALGIGMCDVIADRLVNKIDWTPTYTNSLASGWMANCRLASHFPTDRECLERIVPTVGKFNFSEVTLGWIRNTLELSVLGLSENLRAEIEKDSTLEILGPAREIEFDSSGNLVDLITESSRSMKTGAH